jgi:hypothetical protein
MTSPSLIFYSAHTRELQGTTRNKIVAIIAQDAIEYDKENKCYICKPIKQRDGKPYNSTTYRMPSHKAFGFQCDCQGWQSKFKKHMADPINNGAPGCSHVAALYEFLKRRNMSIRTEKVAVGMQMTFGSD